MVVAVARPVGLALAPRVKSAVTPRGSGAPTVTVGALA